MHVTGSALHIYPWRQSESWNERAANAHLKAGERLIREQDRAGGDAGGTSRGYMLRHVSEHCIGNFPGSSISQGT